ncbi:MAG: sensor histidine kinase [Bacteroidota bacterium]
MKYRNIEIAVVTIVLLMALYSLLGDFIRFMNYGANGDAYRVNYLVSLGLDYLAMYTSFIWVACSLPNKFMGKGEWGKAGICIIFGWIVFWLLLFLGDFIAKPYKTNAGNDFYREFGTSFGIYAMLVIYQTLKHIIIWALNRDQLKQSWKQKTMATEVIWFILLWVICLLTCMFLQAYWGVTLFIMLMVPCMFLVYLSGLYWLIPQYYQQVDNITFWARVALVTLIINIPLNGIFTARSTRGGNFFIFGECFLLFWVLQMAVIIPITLHIYKLRKERNAELTGLKTELGTTSANLQYLRSQINPHFLFNALNTLYGTALMEKADKTGEGIQKLGDMMRFMLHENNQDKIALSREIDYLHNYIDLQNMRLALSPDIIIDIQIEDIIGYDEIAPMLLIPFVENAYKHGISLQAKSWINVNLYKTDNLLHLDVHNSIHPINLNDPERYHSGTGLDNVKQRLQLLYPQKHELVIRQNAKEFFIHLTITLNTQKPS